MKQITYILSILTLMLTLASSAQDIELFQQYNGRFDYTAIGNTLNPFENNIDQSFCFPLESSSAQLNLPNNITITAAYLYWAGSGSGDTTVMLNGLPIEADDTYVVDYQSPFNGLLNYFSCYADITDQIITEGNTTYELSDLDLTDVLIPDVGYCDNRTNFAGWSIYIIYEDDDLPLNQVNLYQGLEIINNNTQEKTIIIDNLNVIDNEGAKIGFLAWEGDNNLNFGERLIFNGNVLSNPPLNFSDNVFNGTNTFTNSTTFYNCDLDVYNIEDNITIGDTSATIVMTTGELIGTQIVADLIIINNIITVLNSQLPDATITVDSFDINCGERTVDVDYTVYNTNSTEVLPSNTPIAFYAEGILIGQSQTINEIAIGGSEMSSITLTLSDDIPSEFLLVAVVDDDGTGIGTIIETNENNNSNQLIVELLVIPPIQELPEQIACDEGFNSAIFDLVALLNSTITIDDDTEFYESIEDLEADENAIIEPEAYSNSANPITIYAKVEVPPCYDTYAFELSVDNCPPNIPDGFSPNSDGINDWFNIQGLYDVFEQHELKIFNRYGTLIFEGNNNNRWKGLINRGLNNHGKLVPVGTYYYILYLNEPNFEPEVGWVYINY